MQLLTLLCSKYKYARTALVVVKQLLSSKSSWARVSLNSSRLCMLCLEWHASGQAIGRPWWWFPFKRRTEKYGPTSWGSHFPASLGTSVLGYWRRESDGWMNLRLNKVYVLVMENWARSLSFQGYSRVCGSLVKESVSRYLACCYGPFRNNAFKMKSTFNMYSSNINLFNTDGEQFSLE